MVLQKHLHLHLKLITCCGVIKFILLYFMLQQHFIIRGKPETTNCLMSFQKLLKMPQLKSTLGFRNVLFKYWLQLFHLWPDIFQIVSWWEFDHIKMSEAGLNQTNWEKWPMVPLKLLLVWSLQLPLLHWDVSLVLVISHVTVSPKKWCDSMWFSPKRKWNLTGTQMEVQFQNPCSYWKYRHPCFTEHHVHVLHQCSNKTENTLHQIHETSKISVILNYNTLLSVSNLVIVWVLCVYFLLNLLFLVEDFMMSLSSVCC